MALRGPPRFKDTARGRRDTHSTYLKLMAEGGVVGFTIFMAMIVITLVNSHRTRKRVEAKAPALASQLFNMEVGLYGFLVAGIWGSYGGFLLLYIHLAIMYACTRLVEEDVNGSGVPLGRGRSVRPLAGAAIPYAGARP
jgi:O-antigen ligase